MSYGYIRVGIKVFQGLLFVFDGCETGIVVS
jgi:hypothetical protein